MADAARRLHIICYDITDPRRLARVHRCLAREGLALQYSVFVVHEDRAGLDALLTVLGSIIDPETDDLRAYTLPSRVSCQQLGRQLVPDGVMLVSDDLPACLLTGGTN